LGAFAETLVGEISAEAAFEIAVRSFVGVLAFDEVSALARATCPLFVA
jgi:hypothetical protein